MAETGATLSEAVEEGELTTWPAIRAFQLFRSEQIRRSSPRTVCWIWGPSGVGKTRLAYNIIKTHLARKGRADVVPPIIEAPTKTGTWWWNGYNGEEAMVVDNVHDPLDSRFLRAIDV